MPDKVAAGARLGKLGRYEVLNELGKGAMGIVYLAKDPVIGRMVAIKTIRTSHTGDDDSESREFRERFVREAQTAGILSHPNIVTIHDIGEDTGSRTSFIAMEYIEGRNLKSLLGEKKKFNWDEIADLIAQIAEALDYAHRKGIIHRDIKPANIIMTTDGKIKITDFGIAKIASSNLTTTGQFLGTPNYMSPEQVSGAPVDGRSDIFSLGVVLYELLTNRKPFLGDNLTAISYKIVHEDFTPPADLSSEVPPEFNSIVARAMAKDPWNRYQRGKDLALALYQLKAHLEEQKALEDLGTMVSAAENLPTLKLSNLQELAAMGAPRDTTASRPLPTPRPSTSVPPPPPLEREATRAEVSPPEAMNSTDPVSISPLTRVSPPPPLSPSEPEAALPMAASWPETAEPAQPPMEPPTVEQDWKKLAKAEVNPRWFWRIVGAGALVLLALAVGYFATRAKSASPPPTEHDAALEQDVRQRKLALEEGKRLFSAGKYEESLAQFRQVLARSPNNQEARQYAQMAENAVTSHQQEQQRVQQAGALVEAAKTSLSEGRNDEAKTRAEEILALDASNADALAIRDEADKKITDARSAADTARKKTAKAKEQLAKKNLAPSPAPVASKVAAPAVQGPAPVPVPGNATLRLTFQSPIPEGNIMVAVNDQILLRKSFSFKKNENRIVSANLTVASGTVAVKAWFSGPNMPAVLAATSTQLNGGESHTLLIDYAGGGLTVKVQ
ncbi:MAG: protein kinase [Acidobacteriota bacterium]